MFEFTETESVVVVAVEAGEDLVHELKSQHMNHCEKRKTVVRYWGLSYLDRSILVPREVRDHLCIAVKSEHGS